MLIKCINTYLVMCYSGAFAVIKIYGATLSRTARCLWMLEELGQPYQQIDVAPGSEDARGPEYLAINPNGRVPTMVDGETVLWESMAINLYLADKYDGGLWPAKVEDRGRAYSWSFWGMMEAEAHLLSAMFNLVTRPEEQRDTAAGEKAVEALQKPLGVLNGALRGRPYLLGEKFSVADLNLAAIFAWAKVARLDLSAYPEAANWLNTCLARDGWRKLFPKNK